MTKKRVSKKSSSKRNGSNNLSPKNILILILVVVVILFLISSYTGNATRKSFKSAKSAKSFEKSSVPPSTSSSSSRDSSSSSDSEQNQERDERDSTPAGSSRGTECYRNYVRHECLPGIWLPDSVTRDCRGQEISRVRDSQIITCVNSIVSIDYYACLDGVNGGPAEPTHDNVNCLEGCNAQGTGCNDDY